MKLQYFLSLFFLFIIGCATRGSVYIEDLSVSIVELQKIITEVTPIRIRQQSRNGRQFASEYFVEKKGKYVEGQREPRRMTSIISIHGDRRPYTLEINVSVEERGSEANYQHVGYDQGLSTVISRRIQKALHQRREDRNIIDDFRVF